MGTAHSQTVIRIFLLSLMLLHASLLHVFPGAGSSMQGLSLRLSPLVYWGTFCSSIIAYCAWPCILQITEQAVGLCMEKGLGGTCQTPSLCNTPATVILATAFLSGQCASWEMGEPLALQVQIFAPKLLLELWRGRAVPQCPCPPGGDPLQCSVTLPVAEPCGSPPFPYLFFSL